MSQHEYGHQGLFINPRYVTAVGPVIASQNTGLSQFQVYIQGDSEATKVLYNSTAEAEEARDRLISAALSAH